MRKRGSGAEGKDGGPEALDFNDTEIKDEEQIDQVFGKTPSWTYVFKPVLPQGQNVGIGYLYIRVISAKNLPIMDMLRCTET